MARLVEECPYRAQVRLPDGTEAADCGLLRRAVEDDGFPLEVRRDACERCSRLPAPSPERLNSVVASLLYELTGRIMAAGGAPGCTLEKILELQKRAVDQLEMATPQRAPPSTPELPLGARAPQRLIDRDVTSDSFKGHFLRGEPFSYWRYGDSEWLSILDARGRNNAEHDFFPDTLTGELRDSLDYLASLHSQGRHLYAGLHEVWHQYSIQTYLQARRLTGRIRWVDNIVLQAGLRDLSTKRFFEAVRDSSGPKYLVANRRLAPVARGLGCTHVIIPEVNCYLEIDGMERACQFSGPGLVLCCAAMAAECLFYRLHRRNPSGTYVDCGHIFDAMIGRPSRRYTRHDEGGIMDFLRMHYRPMFLPDGTD